MDSIDSADSARTRPKYLSPFRLAPSQPASYPSRTSISDVLQASLRHKHHQRTMSGSSSKRDGSTGLNSDRPKKRAREGGANRRAPYALAACDFCHGRKLKCSGDRPCIRCQKQGLSCSYPAAPLLQDQLLVNEEHNTRQPIGT